MAERFNVNENRLEHLSELMADARLGKRKMSSKQHKEYLNLKAAYNGFAKDYDLQQTLNVHRHPPLLTGWQRYVPRQLVTMKR